MGMSPAALASDMRHVLVLVLLVGRLDDADPRIRSIAAELLIGTVFSSRSQHACTWQRICSILYFCMPCANEYVRVLLKVSQGHRAYGVCGSAAKAAAANCSMKDLIFGAPRLLEWVGWNCVKREQLLGTHLQHLNMHFSCLSLQSCHMFTCLASSCQAAVLESQSCPDCVSPKSARYTLLTYNVFSRRWIG